MNLLYSRFWSGRIVDLDAKSYIAYFDLETNEGWSQRFREKVEKFFIKKSFIEMMILRNETWLLENLFIVETFINKIIKCHHKTTTTSKLFFRSLNSLVQEKISSLEIYLSSRRQGYTLLISFYSFHLDLSDLHNNLT